MHTSLPVIGVHSDLSVSVVAGVGFCGWTAPEPVLVVPGHPRGGDVLQVGQGVDRPVRNGEPSRTLMVL